jgi:hypothetical protein
VNNSKVTLLTITDMVREFSLGRMVNNIKEAG